MRAGGHRLRAGSDCPGRYSGTEQHERLIRNVDPICGGAVRPPQRFYPALTSPSRMCATRPPVARTTA
jgi:hypothetical protein